MAVNRRPFASHVRAALQVALIYLAVGVAWILGSDALVEGLWSDPRAITVAQSWKGAFFIGATAVMVFVLVLIYLRRALASEWERVESESRFQATFDEAVTGMTVLDMEARLQRANDALCRMLGYTCDELMSMHVLEVTHPDDREARMDHMRRLLAGERPEPVELRYIRRDGRVLWVLVNSAVRRDATGAPAGFVSQVVDITAQHTAQQQLEHLRARLEQGARLTTLGEASAELAHELSQPLGAVLHYAEACADLVQKDTPDMALLREGIDALVTQARRGRDIVERLRRFSRSNAPRLAPIDINELVRASVRLLAHEAQRYNVRSRLHLQENLPLAMADELQIQQVLVNLHSNAIESLRDRPEEERVVVLETLGRDGRVRVAVRDHGPGLPESVRQRLFDPFFTTKSEGMGLGLPISRTIVEAHGSRLHVTRVEGWTEFSFELATSTGE